VRRQKSSTASSSRARTLFAISKIRDLARLARDLQDVHARVGAIDDVDVATVVDLEVVGLDGDLAALLAVGIFTQRLSVFPVFAGM